MRRFRDIPISTKLTAVIVATFFVALILGGTALVVRYSATERSKVADRLTILARVIGANTSAAVAFNDPAAAQETLAALVAERSIVAAYVFDRRGEPFARFFATADAWMAADMARMEGLGRDAGSRAGVVFEAERLSVSAPVVLDEDRIGTVVLHADLRPLRLALLRDVGVFSLVMLPATLVALALSAVLQRIVSAPILGLAEAMKRISGAKDYSLRAEKHGDDEVGSLIDGFNEMLSQIQARDEQLRLAANALESTGDAIMITDPRLRIVSVNRAFTTMTGYTPAEVLGRRPAMLRSDRHESGFYSKIRATIAAEGQWHGEIWGRRKSGDVYPQWVTIGGVKDQQGRVSHYVMVGNDISQYKDYEARLEFLAHHDTLTQLPNRALFRAHLQETLLRARRQGERVGLMFVDLDRFKPINDTLGHAVGDQLLVAAARRIRSSLRESDMVARYGGDEFVILLGGLRQAGDAGPIAEKLRNELNQPFMLAGHELSISASMGIAVCPDDGEDVETLLKHADAAMYAVKAQGRNGCGFHSAGAAELRSGTLRETLPPDIPLA